MIEGEDPVSRPGSALYSESGRSAAHPSDARRQFMKPFRVALTLTVARAVALVIGFPLGTQSQEKTIKIGLIFDFSGPFSAAGSLLNYRGAKLAIGWTNDRSESAGW